eukprot:gnl/MRDRNA2_/MRDRNA2_63550_c0_seq1.p1 gnl/MRDRNA2_/MRDRNA2_63550_c0~~gnl/MRDRNA2_/MRDRNA2_63550_c0_seq1.p1  ORF type:complete len:458 (-),score=115.94 gnl/MRDRNA2_/MRDRNA2_63550_c0_seq1:113-1486(-)
MSIADKSQQAPMLSTQRSPRPIQQGKSFVVTGRGTDLRSEPQMKVVKQTVKGTGKTKNQHVVQLAQGLGWHPGMSYEESVIFQERLRSLQAFAHPGNKSLGKPTSAKGKGKGSLALGKGKGLAPASTKGSLALGKGKGPRPPPEGQGGEDVENNSNLEVAIDESLDAKIGNQESIQQLVDNQEGVESNQSPEVAIDRSSDAEIYAQESDASGKQFVDNHEGVENNANLELAIDASSDAKIYNQESDASAKQAVGKHEGVVHNISTAREVTISGSADVKIGNQESDANSKQLVDAHERQENNANLETVNDASSSVKTDEQQSPVSVKQLVAEMEAKSTGNINNGDAIGFPIGGSSEKSDAAPVAVDSNLDSESRVPGPSIPVDPEGVVVNSGHAVANGGSMASDNMQSRGVAQQKGSTRGKMLIQGKGKPAFVSGKGPAPAKGKGTLLWSKALSSSST